jgi:hypothetical protein
MAGFTTIRFPHIQDQLRRLIEQHLEIKDEPLHLALVFDPRRDTTDIFLFEVASDFGGNMVAPEKEFFEMAYGSSDAFPMPEGQQLRFVMTNPEELRAAEAEGWNSLKEVEDAVRRGDYEVLFADKAGESILRELRNE